MVNADGTLTYRGDANYNGTDVVTYTVSDGTVTRTATVTVTIMPVNDALLAQNDSAPPWRTRPSRLRCWRMTAIRTAIP